MKELLIHADTNPLILKKPFFYRGFPTIDLAPIDFRYYIIFFRDAHLSETDQDQMVIIYLGALYFSFQDTAVHAVTPYIPFSISFNSTWLFLLCTKAIWTLYICSLFLLGFLDLAACEHL